MEANDEDFIFRIILAGYEISRRRKLSKRRTIWVKKWLSKRKKYGVTNTLLTELRSEEDDYRRYLRMDTATFDFLLDSVRPTIERQDTNLRCCISAADRLALTLRYLATGNNPLLH